MPWDAGCSPAIGLAQFSRMTRTCRHRILTCVGRLMGGPEFALRVVFVSGRVFQKVGLDSLGLGLVEKAGLFPSLFDAAAGVVEIALINFDADKLAP